MMPAGTVHDPYLRPEPEDYEAFEPAPARVAKDHGLQPEEPVFTLRAQDVLAPAVVRAWCEMASVLSVNPEKIREARQIALAMEHWISRKVPD